MKKKSSKNLPKRESFSNATSMTLRGKHYIFKNGVPVEVKEKKK